MPEISLWRQIKAHGSGYLRAYLKITRADWSNPCINYKKIQVNRSGQACDQWNRFEEDFKLSQTLSRTAHRFSIEWSRIEPQEGQWDSVALDQYTWDLVPHKGFVPRSGMIGVNDTTQEREVRDPAGIFAEIIRPEKLLF